jgi:hypothetical protein
MINIVSVLVHKIVEECDVPVVRVIVFEADEDGTSVLDILEADLDNEQGVRWIAEAAANYGLPILMEGASGERVNLDDIDTGRARKTASRIVRALEKL